MKSFSDFARELLIQYENVTVVLPGDHAYEACRKLYNRMHDLYPAMIFQTMNVSALKEIISYGAQHDIELAIRGGGHHIAGFGSTQGGILIDFSPFTDIKIDAEKGLARILPGARLRDVDNALCPKGYVIPTGTVSDTGIAGLTLGGGIGWLVGSLGFTCENLIGADLLLANGMVVRAEDPEHAELLWALRGGGGNFGIVLEFRFRLSPLPTVYCGTFDVFDEDIEDVLKKLFIYLNDECSSSLVVAPVIKVVNEASSCKLSIDFCLSDAADKREIETLEKCLGASVKHQFLTCDYVTWQSWSDAVYATPMRGYWKSVCPESMGEEIAGSLLTWAKNMPDENCSITLEHFNPVRRANKGQAVALPIVSASYGVLFSARWLAPEDDLKYMHWVKSSAACMAEQWGGAPYSNYSPVEKDSACFNFSKNDQRLLGVKHTYDPVNVFRRNHNVKVPEPIGRVMP